MESTIKELYYGNIPLSDRDFKKNSEYSHILRFVSRHEESLMSSLTEVQKETFEKFKDGTTEIEGMTEVAAFTIGFKLGLRLTAEAFIGSEQNLIDD